MTAPVAASPPRATRLPATFWFLFSAQLISRMASFAQPFLALYLTQGHGVSAATAGAIVSGVGVGSVVAICAGGWAADRFGRRLPMLTGQVVAALALVWLASANEMWQLWTSAVLVGFGGDLVRPAMSATVSDVVPRRHHIRAYGLMFWAINLGFVVATVSAGQLVRWGYPTLFVVEACAAVVAGLIIVAGVPETRPRATDAHVPLLPVLLRDRATLMLVAVGILYSVVYFQAYATLPVVMAGQGLSGAMYGVIIAANGVIICLLQPLALRLVERFAPERVYVFGMLVFGAGFVMTSLARSPWQHALVVSVWSLGEIAVAGVAGALFARRAPAGLTGRYLGLMSLSFAAGAAVGPTVGGAVLQAWGASVVWLGCGALAAVGAGLLSVVGRRGGPAAST